MGEACSPSKNKHGLPQDTFTQLFIITVFHTFLTEDARISLLLLLVSVIVLAQSKWLLTQYMKIEAQFLANLRGHHSENKEDGAVD